MNNLEEIILELKTIFPYDEQDMCEDKYRELVSDYLHEEIISKLTI